MIDITFYTTAGCHLCEQASELLQQCQSYPLNITTEDIALDNELTEKYGIRIPVLRFNDQSELNWPFDLEILISKLETTTSN